MSSSNNDKLTNKKKRKVSVDEETDNMSSTNHNNKMANKKKRKVFGDEETDNLLELWASDKIQKQFHATTRHNLIYESISRQLKELGFTCTSVEVRSKILNLKTEYRSRKPKSGGSPPNWKYFAIMNKVLGQRDAVNDDLMDESLADEQAVLNGDCDEDDPGSDNGNDYDEMNGESLSQSQEHQSQDRENCMKVPRVPGQAPGHQLRVRKISRPPRRAHSREDKLIDTLVASEQAFQKRLDVLQEQEKKNEQRDELVAKSMTRFLTAFAVLAENSIKQGASCFPPQLLQTQNAVNFEDNVARSNPRINICKPSVQNNIEETPLSTKQPKKTHNRKSNTMAPPPALFASGSGSQEHCRAMPDIDTKVDTIVEYLDEDLGIDIPTSRESSLLEDEYSSNDPIIQYLQDQEDEKNFPPFEKTNKATQPKIISHEVLQQRYEISKNVCFTGSNIDIKPSSTPLPPYINANRRLKSGSIIICKDNH